jgi:DNA polymerase III sliding clamp (beta) subunit (PCNA family)
VQSEDEQMKMLIEKSSLASEIAQLYGFLEKSTQGHILINNFIEVSFGNPEDHQLDYVIQAEPVVSTSLDIQPYHTLLLLHESIDIIRSFPMDFSPALLSFLQITTPTQWYGTIVSRISLTLL